MIWRRILKDSASWNCMVMMMIYVLWWSICVSRKKITFSLCVTKKDHFLTLCQGEVLDVFRDVSKMLTSKQCDGYAVNHLFAILIRVSHKKKKTFSRRSVGAHSAEEQTLSQRFPNRFWCTKLTGSMCTFRNWFWKKIHGAFFVEKNPFFFLLLSSYPSQFFTI